MNSYQNKKRKRNLIKKLKLKYKLRVLKALAWKKYWDSLTSEEKREYLFPSLPSKDFTDFISEFPEVNVANKEFYEWKLSQK